MQEVALVRADYMGYARRRPAPIPDGEKSNCGC